MANIVQSTLRPPPLCAASWPTDLEGSREPEVGPLLK
jgi:hypothetical protein